MSEFDNAYIMLKTIMAARDNSFNELKLTANSIIDTFFSNLNNKEELKEDIVNRYIINVGVKAYSPDVLLDDYTKMDSWVRLKKDKVCHEYFTRYISYLRGKDYPEDVIKKMENYTEIILSKCANPESINSLNKEKKKGLIIGDVQSGKTANYIALMNMAADYGYKLIVLLAGLTDSLRIQTQQRVDEGFVGANSSTINGDIEFIGVGKQESKYWGIPMTNQDYDFSKFIKENTNSTTGDYNKPIVMVVKKNKNTLTQMKKWVTPDRFGTKVQNILIIDDEADNASVNTRDGEDPSIINKLIRELYNNFPVATYVGYTATPFANILIDPYDDESNRDLFPSDFIVQLKEPDNYFGSKKIFNNENKYLKVLDENEENFLPVNHKKEDEIFDELPESLKEAINDFILVNVLRTLKGKPLAHRTMMINISRFNNIQDKIKYKVDRYLEKVRNIIEQTYLMSTTDFIREPLMKKIYNQYIYDEFYEIHREEYTWDQLQCCLYEEISKFETIVINNRNSKKNRFDYNGYKNSGARVISIGGFVLSRGLTLEGLLISYFSRNATAYDTMLQMCRWFGYRPGYESLCRIYISQINIDNFGAVIDAVNDLKEQFSEMTLRNKKPIDFGLMIKESPDTLDTKMLVTARNKMRNSKEVYRGLNYSGVSVDTSKIYKDPLKNEQNLMSLIELVNRIKSSGKLMEEVNGRNMFIDVDKKLISEFIAKLNIPLANKKFDKESLSEYILESEDFLKWDIVVATGNKNSDDEPWYFCNEDIIPTRRSFVVREDEDIIRISGSNNRLAEPGIFNSGLTEEQIEEAKNNAKRRHPDKGVVTSDYLSVLNRKPLLVIYPLVLNVDDKNNNKNKVYKESLVNGFKSQKVVLGFALGFPGKEKGIMVKYRANLVKAEQLAFDFEEEEEEEFENED